MRGVSPEQAVIDLVIADQGRVGRHLFPDERGQCPQADRDPLGQLRLGCRSFGARRRFPEDRSTHPRAYGNFARFLGKYVRDEKVVAAGRSHSPPDVACRRRTSDCATAACLKPGMAADVVLFDPATIADHATFDKPMQYATGVRDVFVNGVQVLKDGEPTGAKPGDLSGGPGWTGWPDGGACRKAG